MLIFPAIDLKGGRCVRLTQGRPEEERVYGEDPVAMARHWVGSGARWLHLVDLDGAFAGEPKQLAVVKEIALSVAVPVQLGGGMRSLQQMEAALKAGVSRLILGTAAVQRPELVREACAAFGSERVVVGIDARDGLVAVKGWQDTTGRNFLQVAREMQELGCRRVIFTDTSRDGMLCGPNLSALRQLAESSGLRVIASGGVSCLQDIEELRKLEPLGVEGVILGKALYEGRVQLREALATAG